MSFKPEFNTTKPNSLDPPLNLTDIEPKTDGAPSLQLHAQRVKFM